MKIVKLKAGLGNQMFQYAFSKFLYKKYGIEDVYLDISYFDNNEMRKYLTSGLELLNVNYRVVDKKMLHKAGIFYNNLKAHHLPHRSLAFLQATLNPKYYFEKDRGYRDIDKLIDGTVYFDGYWQSWRYLEPVREILMHDFTPREGMSDQSIQFIDSIKTQNSVFVGIRRGDYLENKKAEAHYGTPSIAYYAKAVSIIQEKIENPFFIIFSDDIEWVKHNADFQKIGINADSIIYRDPEMIVSNFEELFIMASCKHAIISNSTFNFWGAWMNDNEEKVVIAPKEWFKDGKPIDIVPPAWIQI